MTEVLNEADLKPNTGGAAWDVADPTAVQVQSNIDALCSVDKHIAELDAKRKAFLQSMQPDATGVRVIDPDNYGSRREFCIMLARLGRQPHRDRGETKRTSARLGSTIEKFQEDEPVYAKTRSKIPGGNPEYTLGIIIASQAVVISDPIENKAALDVLTAQVRPDDYRMANGRRGEKVTRIYIDDMAAQMEAHADTGSDTPLVIVGQQAVKEYVQDAYNNPRNKPSSKGKDSREIFWAMCESGMTLPRLGFSDKEVESYKARIAANINHVCRDGATYLNDIPMLMPVCGSLSEVRHIITEAQCGRAIQDLHTDFARDYQQLSDLYGL